MMMMMMAVMIGVPRGKMGNVIKGDGPNKWREQKTSHENGQDNTNHTRCTWWLSTQSFDSYLKYCRFTGFTRAQQQQFQLLGQLLSSLPQVIVGHLVLWSLILFLGRAGKALSHSQYCVSRIVFCCVCVVLFVCWITMSLWYPSCLLLLMFNSKNFFWNCGWDGGISFFVLSSSVCAMAETLIVSVLVIFWLRPTESGHTNGHRCGCDVWSVARIFFVFWVCCDGWHAAVQFYDALWNKDAIFNLVKLQATWFIGASSFCV